MIALFDTSYKKNFNYVIRLKLRNKTNKMPCIKILVELYWLTGNFK